MEETAKDKFKNFLEQQDLDANIWTQIFYEKKINRPSQLKYLKASDWTEIENKCGAEWEKEALKRLQTKICNETSEELTKKLISCGLNPLYWSTVFKEMDIVDVNQLQFLDDTTWKGISAKHKHPWEQSALEKLKNSTKKPCPEGVADAKFKEELKNSDVSKIYATVISNASDSISKTSVNFADKMKFDKNENLNYCRNQIKDTVPSSQKESGSFKGFSADSLLEMIKTASDGSILRGLFYTENEMQQSKGVCNVIEICGQIEYFYPQNPEEDEIREFFSKETFTNFNNCLNTGITGIMLPHLSVGFVGNKAKASGTGMKTIFYSKIKYKKVSVQSFSFDETNITLSESVIKELQEIENILIIFGQNSKTAMTLTCRFFREMGTHVNFGLITMGGIYKISAVFDDRTSISLDECKDVVQLTLDQTVTELSNAIPIALKAGGFNKHFGTYEKESVKNNVKVTISKVGGLFEEDPFKWKASLTKNPNLLAIVQRSKPKGIWTMLENHDTKFKNRKILSKFLFETYNEKKDIAIDEENLEMLLRNRELVRFILKWIDNPRKNDLLQLVDTIMSYEQFGRNEYIKELKMTDFFSEFIKLLVERIKSYPCCEICVTKFFLQHFKSQSNCETIDEFLKEPVWRSDFDDVIDLKEYYSKQMKHCFQYKGHIAIEMKKDFIAFVSKELLYLCKNLIVRTVYPGDISYRIFRSSLKHLDSKEYGDNSLFSVKDAFCCIVEGYLRDGRINRLFPRMSKPTDKRLRQFVFQIIIPFWEAMVQEIIEQDAHTEIRHIFLSEVESKCQLCLDPSPVTIFRNKCLKICQDSSVKQPSDLRERFKVVGLFSHTVHMIVRGFIICKNKILY